MILVALIDLAVTRILGSLALSPVQMPGDVDFRVMLTFVEFYTTVMGFTNFRLYHSLNLKYPPQVDGCA